MQNNKAETERAVGFTSGAALSPPKATMTITQADVDIANDICRAAVEKCARRFNPVNGQGILL